MRGWSEIVATDVPDSLIRKLEDLDEQYRRLEARLLEPDVRLSIYMSIYIDVYISILTKVSTSI